jgi:hypothetical protein
MPTGAGELSPRTAYNLVTGLFKPGGKLKRRGAEREGQQVLVVANMEGGDLVIWKVFPSQDTVLVHLQSVR